MGRRKKLTVYSRVVNSEGKELWRSKSGRIDDGGRYNFKTTPSKFWVNGNTWEAMAEWRNTVAIVGYHRLKTAPPVSNVGDKPMKQP